MNLSNDEIKSLKKVLDYMAEFELQHYEECEDKSDHIYNDVIILQNKIIYFFILNLFLFSMFLISIQLFYK